MDDCENTYPLHPDEKVNNRCTEIILSPVERCTPYSLYWNYLQNVTGRRIENVSNSIRKMFGDTLNRLSKWTPLFANYVPFSILRGSQPAYIELVKADVWKTLTVENSTTRIDVTERMLRLWSLVGFGQMKSPLTSIHPECGTDDILEVCYKYQDGQTWRMLCRSSVHFPPYLDGDTRIPEFRFLDRDILSAAWVDPVGNTNIDIYELLFSLAGPGELFHSDCPNQLLEYGSENVESSVDNYLKSYMKIVLVWLKLHTNSCGNLAVTWTDKSVDVYENK